MYGFSPKLITWIEFFLTNVNRTQKVSINGHLSFIISGLPQGTVLGPFFSVFDLYQWYNRRDCVKYSTLRCFATKTYKYIFDAACVTELRQNLGEVTKWLIRINMDPHENKFEYICHGFNRKSLYQLYTTQ